MRARQIDTYLAGKPLTDREKQIIALVAAGYTNPEIGALIHLSPLSVKTHLKRIFQKTGAKSRAHMTAITCPPFRTAFEVAELLRRMRAELAARQTVFCTPEYFRQEGELLVLDKLIAQIGGSVVIDDPAQAGTVTP
jgi:DNA-binding CsgD family transcriptional regulator